MKDARRMALQVTKPVKMKAGTQVYNASNQWVDNDKERRRLTARAYREARKNKGK
jgi:hypothetical protein